MAEQETTPRKEFEAKTAAMAAILDKLRPGTGPGVLWLIMEAWDEGHEAGERQERARCAGIAGGWTGEVNTIRELRRSQRSVPPNSAGDKKGSELNGKNSYSATQRTTGHHGTGGSRR